MPADQAFLDGMTPNERESFIDCAALGALLSRAVAREGWATPVGLADKVVLTDGGAAAAEEVLRSNTDLTRADVCGAALAVLGSTESYVDFAASDGPGLVADMAAAFRERDLVG